MANHVLFLDSWWNPTVQLQAIDRCHRLGQKKVVYVYILYTHGTVEERIVRLQEKKMAMIRNTLDEEPDEWYPSIEAKEKSNESTWRNPAMRDLFTGVRERPSTRDSEVREEASRDVSEDSGDDSDGSVSSHRSQNSQNSQNSQKSRKSSYSIHVSEDSYRSAY